MKTIITLILILMFNPAFGEFFQDISASIKNNLIDQKDAAKVKWVLHLKEIKNVTNEEAFPANKPRYSNWPKAK